MNFKNEGSKRGHRKSHIAIDSNQYLKMHPTRLMMYKHAPKEEISLEEFERFAVDRLKLLRDVENINIRFKKNDEKYAKSIRDAIVEFSPNYFQELGYPEKVTDFHVRSDEKIKAIEQETLHGGERRKDHLSHFILRLAFARSDDLRRWFISQEVELFRYRFGEEKSIESFLEANDLQYTPISQEEKETLTEQLQDAMFNVKEENFRATNFYKVPFTNVLDLVKSRRVFLSKGYAYVPSKELVSIIIGIYRSHLSQSLALTAKKLPYLEEDNRLIPLLKNLSSAYIGDSYTSQNEKKDANKLSLKDMEQAVNISYPICMRNLHEGLKRDHHLKHFGRLQYGLFIKAAGLTLDEALLFWRGEFTKKMDLDKFEKQYAYNIRHNYGKEGKRANYTPYSCIKIITTNQPGPGDCHGCPFKHSDIDMLKKKLQNYKLPSGSITEILDLVKQQHYGVACSRYFEVTHKLPNGQVSINHPNQYFDESRKVMSGEKPVSYVKEENVQQATVVKQEIAPPMEEVNDVDFDEEVEML